jgi:hypothetical protein
MRSPGYVNCINWCVKLWVEFSSKLLRESFDYTGVQTDFNFTILQFYISIDLISII